MKRKEPSASLINTLRYKIGGICGARFEQFLVFKRIVELRVWH